MQYFPTWFGVTTDKTQAGYDIFSAPDDDPYVMSYDEVLHQYRTLDDGIKAEEMLPNIKAIK